MEICDGLDNDCNGMIDEGFSLASDPTNCGQCGRVCNVNNGNIQTYACVAATCGIMTCNTGFADCDQAYGTGCEKNVSADVNNCGACNNVCTVANGAAGCANSACTVVAVQHRAGATATCWCPTAASRTPPTRWLTAAAATCRAP